MHTLTSSNRVVWFCTSAPTNFTSFSSQPRPRVLHVIPLMPVPTSLEHLAQTPSLELISLSTPYKRLLCPNSTRARAHTHHTHTQWCRLESCQLPVLWLPPPTDPQRCPPGNPWPSLPSSSEAIANLFSTSCTLSPWPPHLPFTRLHSFPFQEKAYSLHLLRKLAPLIILSLVWMFSLSLVDFFPLDTESSGFSSVSLVHSLRADSP